MQFYAGYREGRAVELEPLPIQYADYALWQRSWMEAGERERQLAYWRQQLGGEQPVLELPTDRPRPSVQSPAGDSLQVELGEDLGRSLKQLAQQQGVTLFMLLLASFQTLLHRYSGQPEIRVGVPIANRTRVETERLIGFFVNTQVLKADFDLETRFDVLLQQVKYRTGSAGPSGPAVRATGRGVAAAAESEPQPIVPGDVQPPERGSRLWSCRGCVSGGAGAGERDGAVRPDSGYL